jgi:RNA polymerase subunit RPABC4/transcription elongation factor Spt4
MDNNTATACKKCHAIVFYDKDAPKPELCPVCQREADEEKRAKEVRGE